MSTWVWLARGGEPGQLAPADALVVPADDRGLLYGDGLFETVRVYDGQVPLWERHLARLRSSAHQIGLAVPWSDTELLAGVHEACSAGAVQGGGFRLTLTRGTGPRGYGPPPEARPVVLVQPFSWHPPEAAYGRGWRLHPVSVVVHPGALTWQLKSLSALEKVMARGEVAVAKADEALLQNVNGYLTEGAASNLFWVRGSELYTPALSCGLLPGIARGLVLALARAGGLTVREGCYTPADLAGADEVFMTNALVQLMPVAEVTGLQTWAPGFGPVGARLMADFSAHVSG